MNTDKKKCLACGEPIDPLQDTVCCTDCIVFYSALWEAPRDVYDRGFRSVYTTLEYLRKIVLESTGGHPPKKK